MKHLNHNIKGLTLLINKVNQNTKQGLICMRRKNEALG